MKLIHSLIKQSLVLAIAISSFSAQAKIYHVSQSSGDDDANGDMATPWKTLAKASIEYKPGDSLLLKCGDTWNEELAPKGSGTAEKPILISSYGKGNKPIIDREDFKQDRSGIRLTDQGGFKIIGLEFAHCMTGIYSEYSKGTINHQYLWIENCYFRDSLHYDRYENYPKSKIGIGVCLFSFELTNKIVASNIMVRNCVFRRLASGFWTNSPDNFNKGASFIYNFSNLIFENCLFEEGYQWQQGIRGVDRGAMRNCVTHDVGRGFRSFNGVAGSMFFRCKNWVFEDCEWGFIDIGLGSGDGEAFDFEGNCDNMIMRNCSFHDTDGPGFLLCCYASDGNPNKGIVMENCLINAKSKRPLQPRVKAAIINTTDWTEATWKNCRFYLSPGEVVMAVMDPEKDKKSTFTKCFIKDLKDACSSPKHPAKISTTTEGDKQIFQLTFAGAVTINEFKVKEDSTSTIARYAIECWDSKKSQWVNCFNGMGIGAEFACPIVSRNTTKARLVVIRTTKDRAVITSFDAFNEPPGDSFDVNKGGVTPSRVGK